MIVRYRAQRCTSTLRLRTAVCTTLTLRELWKLVRHVGAAPTYRVCKTRMLLLHQ